MAQQSPVQNNSASAPRRTLRNEVFGPPRLTWAAQVSVVGFGLLLAVSLVVPFLLGTDASPGFTLTLSGLMIMCGFAELLDPRQLRFVVALRFAGAGAALLGLILQLL